MLCLQIQIPHVAALRKKDAYLDSVSKIRFQETVSSYLFKAGDHFYKIKKVDSEHTSLAVKQAFCQEEAKLLHRLNGEELQAEVLPVYQNGKSFSYKNETGATAIDYALKTTALSERNLVSHLLDQKNSHRLLLDESPANSLKYTQIFLQTTRPHTNEDGQMCCVRYAKTCFIR